MIASVRSVLQNKCGLSRQFPIIVGVSGGTDSLCLMAVLQREGYSVVVAHFDHQLRTESGQDAIFVKEIADRNNLVCRIGTGNVFNHAKRQRMSVEEAARDLRYSFLFDLARQFQAQAVAVGHNADDQVETILMHLIRGSGMAGMRGMSHRTFIPAFDESIPIVRPLLGVKRADITLYCHENQLKPVEDASNSSNLFLRNRVRHELIPQLRTYNPSIEDAILRLGRLVKEDHDVVIDLVMNLWATLSPETGPDYLSFDSGKFLTQKPAIQRQLFRNAFRAIEPNAELDSSMADRSIEYIKSAPTVGHWDVTHGLKLFVESGRVFLSKSGESFFCQLWPQLVEEKTVEIPGVVSLPNGWVLTSDHFASNSLGEIQRFNDPFQAWLDAEKLSGGLNLRRRVPGDTFAPLGFGGRMQKLSDFEINIKMPQRARQRWPLLCDGREIIWVPGYRPSELVALTDSTKQVVHFSLKKQT